ncbi:MAG: SGNH/GDSL hydrolase family protein [Deltaproteobacteria bacterium]|nr:SGNH/GDSL hydrolase family protein [Deltaproteobacteria bacterium]
MSEDVRAASGGGGVRVVSAALLGPPFAALAIGLALRNPLPLAVVAAWLVCAWLVPRPAAGGPRDWWLPPPGVQLRRLAGMVLVPVTLVSAALTAFSAGLTMASIEHGWVLGAGLSVGAAVTVVACARVLDRLGFDASPGPIMGGLVPRPVALGFALAALALAVADRRYVFQYTLFLAALIALAALLALGFVGVVRGWRAGRSVVEVELPLVTLLLGAWLGLFVATLELSALGSYDLVQLADRASRHELRPSPRARIDSFGFRGPERPLAKPAGVVRVVVLGDSMAYGWFVTEEAAFPRVLERSLAAAMPGTPIEVANAGVPAYSLRMMRERFEEKVRALAPDVVVVVDGGNVDAADAAAYERDVRAAVASIVAADASAILCGYPFGLHQDGTRWTSATKQRVADELGLSYVDLLPSEASVGERFFQPDETHPTAAGHAAIAARLAPVVRAAIEHRRPTLAARLRSPSSSLARILDRARAPAAQTSKVGSGAGRQMSRATLSSSSKSVNVTA